MDESELLAHQTLTETYLKRFNSFLEENSTRLIRILEGDNNKTLNGGTTEHLQIESPTLEESYGSGFSEKYRKGTSSFVTAFALTQNVWDITSDPIKITCGPIIDTCTFDELIFLNNQQSGDDVEKVMLVIVHLTNQFRDLKQMGWDKFLYQFLLYGDSFEVESLSGSPSSSVTEGEGHISISKFLPVIYELVDYVNNCRDLIGHCLLQLAAIFKDSRPHVVCITGLQLPTLLRALGDLLGFHVILDEVLSSHTTLHEHWNKYRRMIKSILADSANFGVTDSEELLRLEKVLSQLDKEVVSGHIFQTIVQNIKQDVGKKIKSTTLVDKLTFQLQTMGTTIEKEFSEGVDEFKPISFAALYVFTASLLSPTFDAKKIFNRTIWENLKKIPAVPLVGSVLWTAETFLNSFHLNNNNLDIKVVQSQASNRHNFLQQKSNGLQRDVITYQFQVNCWVLRLQEAFFAKEISQLRLEDLSKRCNLLLEGVKLAQILSQTFRLVINLHAILARPVTKQMIASLCQYLEMLKVIQSTFHRFNVQICYSVTLIIQTVTHIALSNVKSVVEYVKGNTVVLGKDTDVRSESLCVLRILENSLKGPPSKQRLLVAKVSLDWAMASSKLWRDEEQRLTIEAALERLINLTEMQIRIDEYCNGSGIYWHRIILSSYFSSIYGNEIEGSKLPLMFLVLQDCLKLLEEKSPHKEVAILTFIQEIHGYFKSQLVDKLCQDVETNLRLLSHSHLQPQQQQQQQQQQHVQSGGSSDTIFPFRHGVKEYNNLLEVPSLIFGQQKFKLKYITEYYLSKNFYNLASVALHDWQSYATMRVLAGDKFQLNIMEDHLPGHSLEQGLDILEVVRNLNKFVIEFSYNLNNQVFVQVSSPNKHLDTLNIRHLANSMRTHGPGMANTTVNFTYQFLRTKIHIFSQFLYDEQIKSRLAKDVRLFKQLRGQESTGLSNNSSSSSSFPFPYDRAQRFQRGIRKLGVTTEGLSPLDQFRILITHIGNALGFVRLVRSGGLHFLAAGCRFVPDLEYIEDFPDLLMNLIETPTSIVWQEELRTASSSLDSSLKTLTSSFSGGVDYFKLLASAFAAPCRDTRNSHLKNFFAIIPALTLSYVDHMRSCKEKLAKKSKSTTLFTDDGFPMGVAYLLKVLGQDADFDSLQWFSGVRNKLVEEREKALQTITESKKDEKLQQANTLTAKRVQDFLHEFNLLRYSLSSARIFFQQAEIHSPLPNV